MPEAPEQKPWGLTGLKLKDPEALYILMAALVEQLYGEEIRGVNTDLSDRDHPKIVAGLAPDVSHINVSFTIDIENAESPGEAGLSDLRSCDGADPPEVSVAIP